VGDSNFIVESPAVLFYRCCVIKDMIKISYISPSYRIRIMDSKLVLGVIIMITLGVSFVLTIQDGYSATRNYNGESQSAVVGSNEYVAWFSNKSGNWEVMFRSSTDGGQTFSDKINLSNTTETDSVDVEISADGENVLVTWWERGATNSTSDEPVSRVSTDGGQTFNDLVRLSVNGTIGNVEGVG
jgi:hypothetical protein